MNVLSSAMNSEIGSYFCMFKYDFMHSCSAQIFIICLEPEIELERSKMMQHLSFDLESFSFKSFMGDLVETDIVRLGLQGAFAGVFLHFDSVLWGLLNFLILFFHKVAYH